jgi:hypothetical protein
MLSLNKKFLKILREQLRIKTLIPPPKKELKNNLNKTTRNKNPSKGRILFGRQQKDRVSEKANKEYEHTCQKVR